MAKSRGLDGPGDALVTRAEVVRAINAALHRHVQRDHLPPVPWYRKAETRFYVWWYGTRLGKWWLGRARALPIIAPADGSMVVREHGATFTEADLERAQALGSQDVRATLDEINARVRKGMIE